MPTEWTLAGASVRGARHEASGEACQDAFVIASLRGDYETWLAVACCDGAGSATHGGTGAVVTAQVVVRKLGQLVETGGFQGVDSDAWIIILEQVKADLRAEADVLGVSLGDLATTLVAGVISGNAASFAQIGDGAVVLLRDDAGQVAVGWPQSGEFANTTNFVTGDNARGVMQCTEISGPIGAFAFFSDGLERLILDFAERRVPGGFLTPMWSALTEAEQQRDFNEDLAGFLRSDRVRVRTDDDVTLLLGVRNTTDQAHGEG